MLWMQSAPKFEFVLDDHGVHAEGEMKRERIGREVVQFKTGSDEWRATAGMRGVVWERRNGGAWSAADTPLFGNRVYQRVTLAFDPQKKEGAAQLAGNDGNTTHYRFTNANTSEVHELWVNNAGRHVERIRIGDTVDLRITVR